MTYLEAKLSELRRAAETFLRSSETIRQSVATTQEIVDGLIATGYDSPGAMQFLMHYNAQRGPMNEWAGTLAQFGRLLGGTADELDRINRERSDRPFRLPRTRHDLGDPTPLVTAAAAAQPVSPVYLSQINLRLQAQVWDLREQLATERAEVDALIRQRDERVQTLTDLRVRISDTGTNPDAVARVRVLQGEIDSLNQQITEREIRGADVQAQIREYELRLERVQPMPGASPPLLLELEQGQTNPWVQANTQDCVQYIAQRMPIPDGLAGDAHLWDDLARSRPEYGIRVSDTPLVGSVIVMEREHSYANPQYGHLLYVEAVDRDGVVWVTDNGHPEPVRLTDLTGEVSGDNLHYLVLPWHTRA